MKLFAAAVFISDDWLNADKLKILRKAETNLAKKCFNERRFAAAERPSNTDQLALQSFKWFRSIYHFIIKSATTIDIESRKSRFPCGKMCGTHIKELFRRLTGISSLLFTCNSSYCCSASKPSQFCLPVCHKGGSVKNGASYDHQIFIVGCLKDSSFRNRKAFP